MVCNFYYELVGSEWIFPPVKNCVPWVVRLSLDCVCKFAPARVLEISPVLSQLLYFFLSLIFLPHSESTELLSVYGTGLVSCFSG